MKYLMMIKHAESYRSEEVPKALSTAMDAFIGEYAQRGVFKDGGGLKPSANGFQIRLGGGKLQITDGPFTEAKEIIGGYAIVDVASDAEARDLAMKFMELHRVHWPAFEGVSECRPFEDMPA